MHNNNPTGANKVKNHGNNYMSKHEAGQYSSAAYSSITEEKSFDEVDGDFDNWQEKEEQIRVIQAMYEEDNVSIVQQPTSDDPGAFTIRVKPNCGDQEVGCYIELVITYENLKNLNFTCEIVSTDGLDETQVNALTIEKEMSLDDGDSLEAHLQKM